MRSCGRAVVEMVSGGEASHAEAMVTNLRQQQAVERAVWRWRGREGRRVRGCLHEMVLLDLYECLQALDSLTGATSSDDILHLIFSRFCIGK